jgi:predicted CXXCH cytochrome family protein
MKNVTLSILIVLFSVGTALCGDTVNFTAKNGNVSFPHKKHMAVKQEKGCTACHETAKGGKIAKMGKEWAHKTCKGCHETMKKGPTKCGDCHKK